MDDKTTLSNKKEQRGQTSSPQKEKRRCQFCGQMAPLVWVHGHGQCAACGINAEECCRGETCGNYLQGQ